MKLKRSYFVNTIIFVSFLRFIIIPIEDYPDIIYIYKRTLEFDNWFGSLARYFSLDKLFTFSCNVVKPSNLISDYLIGGGFYKCKSFPISNEYINMFLIILLIFIVFIISFKKLSYRLKTNQRIIFSKTLFFLVLLPSTNYFLLMFHPDNLYNFVIIPFVLLSFYFSFKEKYIKPILISLIPFVFVFLTGKEDNQFFIVLLLWGGYLLSYFLQKKKFIVNFFNNLSEQFVYFLNFKFVRYKKLFLVLTIFIAILIIFILRTRLGIYGVFTAGDYENIPLTGNIQKIAEIYGDENNFLEFSTLDKFPLYLRLFGLFQGFILTTTFGIKPSIITTLLFFTAFFVGFLRCYSFDNVVPLFVKIYFLILLFTTIIIISLFPFYSFPKYWLFLLPFFGLFMSFTPRLSLSSLGLIYLELVLKSSWIN